MVNRMTQEAISNRLESIDEGLIALNEKVGIQNGRVYKLESDVALIKQKSDLMEKAEGLSRSKAMWIGSGLISVGVSLLVVLLNFLINKYLLNG